MQQQNIDIDGKYWSKALVKLFLIPIFISFIDEDGIYDNPNLHPEEQNELEISDGKYTCTSKSYECCFKTTSYLLYHHYYL